MTLRCPSCGASQDIAEGAVSEGALARCEFCRTIFNPSPEYAEMPAGTSPDEGLASDAAPGDSPRRDRWHIEVNAGVYGPVQLEELEDWIREGRVDWEDLISHDGGLWLPALEQRLLVEHFEAHRDDTGPSGPCTRPNGDVPPVKIRPPSITPEQVRRAVMIVAAGVSFSSLLMLNLPGLVIGVGLFAMRRWAHHAALALLGTFVLIFLLGTAWAGTNEAWGYSLGGAALVGLAVGAITVLLRRPVRASFIPGGTGRAAVVLVAATVVSIVIDLSVWRLLERSRESRKITGRIYGYTLSPPSDAWSDLPVPGTLKGHPTADLELTRKDGSARILVVVEGSAGNARSCLEAVEKRVKATGREPTVYQLRRVSAGGLEGMQAIVSLEQGERRISNLITCYVLGGQQYEIIGIAEEKNFERVRSELTRLATSFRLDDSEDPLHLDIQTHYASGEPPDLAEEDNPNSLAGLVSRSQEAVVFVTSYLPGNKRAYGSGAMLRQDGVIITNYHVVARARKIMVAIPGHGTRRARPVGVNEARDLAVLKVPGEGLPFLRLAIGPVRAGDDVIAIGSPMGLTHTVTKGIISSTRRTRNNVDYLQTDVSINPGSSGGPLLNLVGEVIGINTFIIRESKEVVLTGLNFALPTRYVREIAEENGFSLPTHKTLTSAEIKGTDPVISMGDPNTGSRFRRGFPGRP